jgi:hypothetical protein
MGVTSNSTVTTTLFCIGVLLLATVSEAAMDPNIRLTVNSTSIRDGDMVEVSTVYQFPTSSPALLSGICAAGV